MAALVTMRPSSNGRHTESEIERVEVVHQVIQLITRLGHSGRLTLGDSNLHADGISAVGD